MIMAEKMENILIVKHCKTCHNTYACERHQRADVKEWRKKYAAMRLADPEYCERNKRTAAKYYASIKGRAATLLNNARKSPELKLNIAQLLE